MEVTRAEETATEKVTTAVYTHTARSQRKFIRKEQSLTKRTLSIATKQKGAEDNMEEERSVPLSQ